MARNVNGNNSSKSIVCQAVPILMLLLLLLLGSSKLTTVTSFCMPLRQHSSQQPQVRPYWYSAATTTTTNNDDKRILLRQSMQQNDGDNDPFDVPRPDPSILIAAKTPEEQKLWVGGITGIMVVGTVLVVSLLSGLESALPEGWFGILGTIGTVPLGLVFAVLGAAHFAQKATFVGIVPPLGTWGGLWQVPAPYAEQLGLSYEDYHTYWTGVCELGGGVLLAGSGFGLVPEVVQQTDAFLLFLLTVAVTPANIYMATHDAQMVGGPPPMAYPDAHIVRGVIQIVLLAALWKLALH